jgi:hypothetical protein
MTYESGVAKTVNSGGEAVQDRGERRSSPSPFSPRNSSTSLLHLLVLFAGGLKTSGYEGGTSCRGLGGVGDGGAGIGVEAFPPAMVAAAGAATTMEGKQSVLVPTVMEARPCHRQRR